MDIDRIRTTVEWLEAMSTDTQFLQIKNLCQNNGVWTVPDDPRQYNPVLFEISLWQVSCFADDAKDLPKNWLKAALNILEANDAEAAQCSA
ncbi:hypothetical protein [Aestuariivita sp.]|jgi:hypothetical protein|uniref:hypothetical protein n=1 Tax=Aestuariivita sp. TaxID=1872407 RepID=UPI0021725BD9|nr:hypothetical protein [Aestuariivita sp.]MCE8006428.1 hypothetical protein [Aestuariivita sp.]